MTANTAHRLHEEWLQSRQWEIQLEHEHCFNKLLGLLRAEVVLPDHRGHAERDIVGIGACKASDAAATLTITLWTSRPGQVRCPRRPAIRPQGRPGLQLAMPTAFPTDSPLLMCRQG